MTHQKETPAGKMGAEFATDKVCYKSEAEALLLKIQAGDDITPTVGMLAKCVVAGSLPYAKVKLELNSALFGARQPDEAVKIFVAQFDNAKQQAEMLAKRELRERTKAANEIIALGGSSDTLPTAELIDLPEAMHRFVYASKSGQVIDLKTGRVFDSPRIAEQAFQASARTEFHETSGRPRRVLILKSWMQSPDRKTVETVTWRPGHEEFTLCPEGHQAVNLWRPRLRLKPPEDWPRRAAMFEDHVAMLFGPYTEQFLDWIAHILQKPGILPHYGWIHIASYQGCGRNWVSSVFARILSGNVAPSFDLMAALSTQFNGRLSRCLLAVVDEIQEGGGSAWQHSNNLKQIVTADRRVVNPKYGRQSVEYNLTRWFIISNHDSALPLGAEDRRFFVVSYPHPPQVNAYYRGLYAALDDAGFITSVVESLMNRDLSKFNAGERPPLTDAKSRLIKASMTDADCIAQQVRDRWPTDVIYSSDLNDLMDQGGIMASNFRRAKSITRGEIHALERAGIKHHLACPRFRPPNLHLFVQAWVIRNHDFWKDKPKAELIAEHGRIPYEDCLSAFEGGTK